MRLNQLKSLSFLMASTLALAACAEKGAKTRPGIDSAPEVKAEGNINESFLVDQRADGANKVRVLIRKNALEKEFLLQSAVTIMPFLGSSNGYKSRIVAFRRIEDKLFMLEATNGHIVTNDLPQAFILASFPITAESRDAIAFDFNAGMTSLFLAEEWRASDFSGSTPSQDSGAANIKTSFLAAARTTPKNEIVLRQLAQLDLPSPGGLTDLLTVEAKYYLKPYAPDPEFVPTPAANFDWMGFFEVAPRYDDKGVPVVHATKWNPKKPITFAVSANTPDDYKQAVKDGIKYWNQALGVTTIEAIEAPAGVSAPDFDYNVVQWINWDDAGFAYADAQADPRTGEILHAQVFMTSVFAVSGRNAAKKLIDSLKAEQNGNNQARVGVLPSSKNISKSLRSVGLRGLTGRPLCEREALTGLAHALEAALEDGADDAKILKVSQDYVREVVAHEIGHTLGLRHNFAGSLAMNFAASEQRAKFKEYVDAGAAPQGVVPTSSVMEYQLFVPAVLTGDLMSRGAAPFSYDMRAIQTLYNPNAQISGPAPLFCTDTHTMGQFSDCERFDSGASAIESAAYDLSVTTRLLNDKINDGTMDIPMVFLLPADYVASYILRDRPALVGSLVSGKELLRKRRPLSQVWPPVASEDITAVEKAFLNQEIDRLGGLNALLPTIQVPEAPAPEFATLRRNLVNAIAAAEIRALTLSSGNTFVDGEAGDKVLAYLSAKATEIVTATAGEPTDVDGIKLPNFAYPQDLRLAAAKLLKSSQGPSLEWGLGERAALKAALAGTVATAFGQDGTGVDAASLKRPAAKWLLEQRQVLGSLE